MRDLCPESQAKKGVNEKRVINGFNAADKSCEMRVGN